MALIMKESSFLIPQEDEERLLKDRVYPCKSCDRVFPSFQALGGHRASHKNNDRDSSSVSEFKKSFECYICGAKFTKSQALGGHMSRHRTVIQGRPKLDVSVKLSDFVQEKASYNNSLLENPSATNEIVTREFFPKGPLRVKTNPQMEIVPVMKMISWGNDLKLGPPGDYI